MVEEILTDDFAGFSKPKENIQFEKHARDIMQFIAIDFKSFGELVFLKFDVCLTTKELTD